ncbi:MAG: sigma factor-like helix-turn-helix DNA-binding protein [Clostridium sp.]
MINFDEVYERYQKTINFLLIKYSIKDFESELLEHLWRFTLKINITEFQDLQSLDNCVFITLKNISINIFKRETLHNSRFLCIYDEHTSVINKTSTIDSILDNLNYESIILLLNPREKSIIDYKFKDCLSDIEIANLLNISRQAVHKSIKKSLLKLKKEIVNNG